MSFLVRTSRIRLFWSLLAATVVLWILISKFAIPILIARAYRGESLPFFNNMIRGQAAHPIEHYLAKWSILSFIILGGLVALLLMSGFIALVLIPRFRTIDRVLPKYKVALFCAVLLYLIMAHYWVIGFTTWDGFSYRVPPMVELVQHGSLGSMKFDSLWAQHLHPFFELVHIPFLKLFGLPGLFFSFPLVLFPLAIIAVYGFVLQLTHDSRWATYSAIAYVSIPWVNEQPFSAYIDFAVVGAMAFFLFALLRSLREAKLSVRSCALFVVATFVFSMSRQHAFYVAPVVFACVIASEMRPGRPRVAEMLCVKGVAFLAGMFVLALVPAGYQHVSRFLQFGSPIYPYQFKFLGIATHAGVPFEEIFQSAGLRSNSAGAFFSSFVQGWLWSDTVPRGFFDSRMLGVGFLLWTALIGFPIARKRIKGNIAFVLVLLVAIALLLKDFWMPRYSTTLTLALAICVGGILTVLGTEGPGWRYAAVLAICGLHVLGRPVYVAAVDYSVMHSNLADSRWFVDRGTETQVYPDHLADLLVVYPVRFGFVLQFYGRHLTNRIVATLDGSTLQDSCAAIERFAVERSRKLLIVDHSGTVAKKCSSICEPWRHDGCMLRMTSPGK